MSPSRVGEPRSAAPRRAGRFLDAVRIGGAAAVLTIAATTALGWILDVPVLTTAAPALASTKVNTALCLALLAASALCARPRAIVACCAPVVAIATVTISQDVTGADLFIDELLWTDQHTENHPPGRMAAATAVSLGLMAAGRILTAAGLRGKSELVIVAGGSIGGAAELGYWYGYQDLYSAAPFSTMALPTAVAITMLSVVLLAAVPGGCAQWMVGGEDSGARLLRRILPAALFIAPVVALVVRSGEWAGLYADGFALALAMEASALVILGVGIRSATQTRSADRKRARTLAQLHATNQRLEELADRRAQHLAAAQARSQVLADRERIAREVHEQIIGQVFGAGMHVARVLPDVADPVNAQALATAIEDLDGAIKAIRDVIHPLPDHVGAQQARDRAAVAAAVLAASQRGAHEPAPEQPRPPTRGTLRQRRPPARSDGPVGAGT